MDSSPHLALEKVDKVDEVGKGARSTETEEELRRALDREEGGRRWLRRTFVAVAVALAIGAGLVVRARNKPAAASRYMTQAATVGDVTEKVTSSGSQMLVISSTAHYTNQTGELLAENEETIIFVELGRR